MKSWLLGLALVGVAGLGTVGCGASAISPDMVQRAQSHDASASEASMLKGKQLFEAKCGTCHALPAPTSHSAEEWPKWVKSMAPQAKISGDDEKAVLHYLLGASGG